jgi:hypothetical protein
MKLNEKKKGTVILGFCKLGYVLSISDVVFTTVL